MKKSISSIYRLWKILTPFHTKFYTQLCLIILAQMCVVGYAYINSHVLTNLVEKNLSAILSFFSMWVFLLIIDLYIDFLSRSHREKHLEQTLYQHIQEHSLKKVLSLTVAQHIENHSALKLTVISKGEGATQSIIDRIITTVIPTASLMVVSLCTIFYYSKTIALFSFCAITIIFLYAYIVNKKRHPLIVKNRDNWNEQNKIRTEAFSHLQLVKQLSVEEGFIRKYLTNRLRVVKHHLEVRLGTIRHGTIRGTITEFSSLATFGIASYFFIKGMFPIGTIYLIWSVTGRIYWQMSALSNTMREIPILYADTQKYLEVIDMGPSFNEGGAPASSFSGDIVVSNVLFTYPKSTQPTLHNVSFTIQKEKTTAFVGSSGSGKSTIVKLFLRSYNYSEGSITLGGQELSTIDAHHIRTHIGYVEQHVDLFDDTVKENILIAVPKDKRTVAEANLDEIAQRTRIDQFYHRLGEKKFDTIIGERGLKLSGGERQRIGIARAIIKDPEILIFDEATSALDTENEKHVMDAINDVSKGKTTIIIAHRLSTIRNADKIIVMDKGTIVGEGTHEELLAGNSFYQNLVNHQL
jgi:ABC-type multidrug transport system fused ATPase/permease subunit